MQGGELTRGMACLFYAAIATGAYPALEVLALSIKFDYPLLTCLGEHGLLLM